jgi:hypothetical protein
MADGTGRAVLCDRHPDRVAEACRWQVCEGELVQAIGRGRGVNRTASNPLEMDILANVDLPVTVAKVASWDSEGISEFVEMLAEGIILTSPADMAKCWPELWATPKAAEHDIARSAGFPPLSL